MRRHLLLVVSVLAAVGCGEVSRISAHERGSASGDTWGHMSGDTSFWYAALPRGHGISVCGVRREAAVKSLRQWAVAMGRTDVALDADCRPDAERRLTVADRSRPDVDAHCGDRATAAGVADFSRDLILLCVKSDADAVLLHETGHFWGMCDVYPDAAPNCDADYFSGRGRGAVMGASWAKTLSPADREGARRMAARTDLGAAFMAPDFLPPTDAHGGSVPAAIADAIIAAYQ